MNSITNMIQSIVDMFKVLSSKLQSIVGHFSKNKVISADDLVSVLREVRIALLSADVSLSVIKDLLSSLEKDLLGKEIHKKFNAEQMIIDSLYENVLKILMPKTLTPKTVMPAIAALKDNTGTLDTYISGKELAKKLTKEVIANKTQQQEVSDSGKKSMEYLGMPVPGNKKLVLLLLGLQGVGKTSTAAKIAHYYQKNYNQRIVLIGTDCSRPAAKEQLTVLAKSLNLAVITEGETAEEVAKLALSKDYDIYIFDTAGRYMDEELTKEMQQLVNITRPDATILVESALKGQDAINVANYFRQNVPLTGVIMSQMDGDEKGGACLSLRYVTECTIMATCYGEKVSDFAPFDAERIAKQVVGMGDVLGLVEHLKDNINLEELNTEHSLDNFTLESMRSYLVKIAKLGGITKLLSFLPGMDKMLGNLKGKDLKKELAIIDSMTKTERLRPKILNGARKLRIAKGAGVNVSEVNNLLKKFQELLKMFKQFKTNKSMQNSLMSMFK